MENIALSNKTIIEEEKEILKKVYNHFDDDISAQNKDYVSTKEYAMSGKYDSKDGFQQFSAFNTIEKKLYASMDLYYGLKESPFFAHILIKDVDDGELLHCLMTDNENVNESIIIRSNETTMIVPFKQDASRELFSQLFHVFQEKSGGKFSADGFEYDSEFIRQDLIVNQKLESVTQLFPIIIEDGQSVVDCDELLNTILQANRKNSALRNIIATLQRKQFEIIQTNAETSFVVQGCAGSGKSQCLIHRLFFLRDRLANEWEKVLLITPSQLFRNYSSQLMKRYQLTSINNTSLATLYKDILTSIDSRFKNRQYHFELSEEYLPDTYLQHVYSHENIKSIRVEIYNAIQTHINNACNLLGEPYMLRAMTKSAIEVLVDKLKTEIDLFDKREANLAADTELSEMRKHIDELNAKLISLNNSKAKLEERYSKLKNKKNEYDKLVDALNDAEKSRDDWYESLKSEVDVLKNELKKSSDYLDSIVKNEDLLVYISAYSQNLHSVLDYFLANGRNRQKIDDYMSFLSDYVDSCVNEINTFTKGKSINSWITNWEKDCSEIETKLADNQQAIIDTNEELDKETSWMAFHLEDEKYRTQNSKRRADLEKEHYYLSRMESAVFEQEVWKALTPLKTRCDIKTVDIVEDGKGHMRENRILYKSDLLFYLYIYSTLDEIVGTPDYKLICIDEGQDLHKADYALLKTIFPNAVFNIFGDIAQSLHEECGVTNWENDTAIETVYNLETNYRNTAAIVNFCNIKFNENMKYCGNILDDEEPEMLSTSRDEITYVINKRRPAVIVRDKEAYDNLVEIIGSSVNLNYIDTKSTRESEGTISCFSIYAAKGLEFPNVLVYPERMNHNQRVVACTRAMENLYYVDI